MRPNMLANLTIGQEPPSASTMPKSLDLDETERVHQETMRAAQALAIMLTAQPFTKGHVLYRLAASNINRKKWKDLQEGIPRPPNPFEPDHAPRRPGQHPILNLNDGPPEWKNRRSSNTEVNCPEPISLNPSRVQHITDQKVELLRDEFKAELDLAKITLEKRTAKAAQDPSKIMELEIRLKISEEEKDECKDEIRKLQAKVRMLEKAQ
jgi:hypothetical protein